MTAVALSVLSSPLSAVSEEEAIEYLRENYPEAANRDSDVLKYLVKLDDAQFKQFKNIEGSLTEGMSGWNRIRVIETLENVVPEKWVEFKRIANSLLRSGTNISRCDQPMQASEKMPSNSRGPSKTTWIYTVVHNMTEEYRAQVIEALGKVAPENWNKFVLKVDDLTKDMKGEVHAKVIAALVNVAPEIWDEFCSIVNPYW